MRTSWQIKKLGEVCDFQRGLTYSKKDEVAFSNNVVLRATNIDLENNSINLSELKYIRDTFKVPSDKKVRKGSMIICTASGSKSHLGKVALVEHDHGYAFGGFMAQITPKKEIESKYLFYILTSDDYRNFIDGLSSGLNINNLKFDDLKDFQIPLPSLNEQKQIVKKLDEIFEKLTEAKDAAGRNLQNSKELFDSYLQIVFGDQGVDWESKKLNEISKNLDSKRVPITKKVRTSGKYPYYGASGVVDYVDDYIFDDELLLVSEDGANLLARTYPIAFSISGKSWVNNHAHVLKFEKLETQKFIEYYLNSIKLDPYVSGMAQPKLNQKMLNSISVPQPPFSEQKFIVEELEALSEETKVLKKMYTQKLVDLEELRKSLLKMAFSGELSTATSSITTAPQVAVAVPSPYIRNQVHAAIVDQVVRDNGSTTEVAVAKYDHLLQELCGLPLGYQFAIHQFGPFDNQIKRLVSSGLGKNKWFTKRSGMIVFGSNVSALLSRQSNLYHSAQASMKELSRLGITKLDADGVELLSTVCHSIKETGSITIDAVRNFMSNWQTDNNPRTKADKFSEERTQKCLDFILKNNLQQKLLPAT